MMGIIIDDDFIFSALKKAEETTVGQALAAIRKAERNETLKISEAANIIRHAADVEKKLFLAAGKIREEIYGKRMVLFAPVYLTSYCINDCEYCGFRLSNKNIERRVLSADEAEKEARWLHNRGYRRILLEAGEDQPHLPVEQICSMMRRIYGLKDKQGRPMIDRINVNVAATHQDNYRKLLVAGIGTYNLFQETYHRETYEKIHTSGPKHNYERQLHAHHRAATAGIGDIGIGALYGLYDWKYEVLAQIIHSRHLEKTFGIGPHTVSFPRIKTASGVEFLPPYPVDDDDYLRIIAIMRLAIPYAGQVISTREPAFIRRKAFKIGISQTSAGSSTEVGGYSKGRAAGQFAVSDERPLEEVVKELLEDGFVPSFCTACEYNGRQGSVFMKFASTGFIGDLCSANSLLSLAEYIREGEANSFLPKDVINLGLDVIERELNKRLFSAAKIKASIEKILNGDNARDHYI